MRSPLITALLNPLNLAMLAGSALAGAFAAWWLLPLGLALWAIMVANIATDKAIRINYNMEARLGTLSGRFQEPYAKAVKAQMRIFNALLSASGGNKRALEPVQNEVETLVTKIYTVCQQMTAPENFLAVSRAKNADLEGERALLVLSIDKSMAPEILREKQEAIKSLDARIQKTRAISAALDHLDAQLDSTIAVLEALLPDILRLQVLGAAQTRQEVPAILQKLCLETEQLSAAAQEIARLA